MDRDEDDPRPKALRGRLRPWLFMLSLGPNAAFSGWFGLRLSFLADHPVQYPALIFLSAFSLIFAMVGGATYRALGLRWLRLPNGKMILVDASPLLRKQHEDQWRRIDG
jgi:hypothetical protein